MQTASITNTFSTPVVFKGIISKNAEFRISNNYLESYTSSNQIVIQPNESL